MRYRVFGLAFAFILMGCTAVDASKSKQVVAYGRIEGDEFYVAEVDGPPTRVTANDVSARPIIPTLQSHVNTICDSASALNRRLDKPEEAAIQKYAANVTKAPSVALTAIREAGRISALRTKNLQFAMRAILDSLNAGHVARSTETDINGHFVLDSVLAGPNYLWSARLNNEAKFELWWTSVIVRADTSVHADLNQHHLNSVLLTCPR